MHFKENLQAFRKLKKYSRAQMAEKLGMTPTAYGAYELGNREPKLEKVCEIAEILNTTPNALLGYEPSSDTEQAQLEKRYQDFGFQLVRNGLKGQDGNELFSIYDLSSDEDEDYSGPGITLEIAKGILDGLQYLPDYREICHKLIIQAFKEIQIMQVKVIAGQMVDYLNQNNVDPQYKDIAVLLKDKLEKL